MIDLRGEKFAVEVSCYVQLNCYNCRYVFSVAVYPGLAQTHACNCGAHFVVSRMVRSEGSDRVHLGINVERRIVHGQKAAVR